MFTPNELIATDIDSEDSELTYLVTKAPAVGHLQRKQGRGLEEIHPLGQINSFTQGHLNAGQKGGALTSKHKTFVWHLYNVGPTSKTLVQHCINGIQMFCAYWGSGMFEQYLKQLGFKCWNVPGHDHYRQNVDVLLYKHIILSVYYAWLLTFFCRLCSVHTWAWRGIRGVPFYVFFVRSSRKCPDGPSLHYHSAG